jgi:long-chain acyl-CoA synthetase
MDELVYPRLLRPAIDTFAPRPLVTDLGVNRTFTFAEHGDRVARLTQALRGLGVGPGDRFAVMTMNSHAFLELYHAAYVGGGVINPLNLRFAPRELAYVLKDSGTKVCFVDFLFANHIESIREEAGLEHVIMVGDGDGAHTARYEDLLAAAEPVWPAEPGERDPVVLMYTGGTTGAPKGVLLDQRAEMLNTYHVTMRIPFDEHVTYLMQTPMFHAASMFAVMGVPAIGGHTVTIPLFDPAAVMRACEAHKITHTVMVPTMVGMVLGHPDFAPERFTVRNLTYGASPMPRALLDNLLALYPDMELQQGYGMTECSSVLTLLMNADHQRGGDLLASCGRPVPGVVLSIQDEDGTVLPTGEVGEVCARGGNFMTGYWNKPDATEEAFRNGWYHTGDAGRLDAQGYLYLVDRVKDMIVTGGENVYSVEVENALSLHPAVAQVAVIGIPSEQWGEAVHAVVVPKPDTTVTPEELIAHCRDYIAGYKVPKSVELRHEPLPLSGAMKVLKRELREPFWEGHGRRVN